MDENVVNHWKQNLPNIIEAMTQGICGTWTKLDFSGKVCQTATLVLQGEKCKTSKLAKERLTIVLLCSTIGEKFKPLVIGKS
jgi:hypothetical protein